jgi:hypothetical protein
MSSLAVSGIVFACIFAGAILGVVLRNRLPENHLSPDSKDVIKLGMGLVGTMTAMVLGLLIASAKSSFDAQRNGLAQLAGDIVVLDRTLAHYGSETKEVRDLLRDSVADMIRNTWPGEGSESGPAERDASTEGKYEGIYDKIQQLSPRTDAQKALQAHALKTVGDAVQTRWLMFSQRSSSIPTPFLVVMVAWLVVILTSFGLFAPRNGTALLALLVCSLTVSSAIFLILELDRPFKGMIQISSEPLRNAMAQLGR